MAAAAIFDLDRTLIAGSSAQTFGQMLRDVGVDVPSPPGQGAYFALYRRFGEDPVTMRVARHAARLFKGQSVAKVQTAGRLAADALTGHVSAKAQQVCICHRSSGTKLLLATTAPVELAEPLADALGFDDVISTRYRSVDGIYDGTNESQYYWGEDKAEAVAQWAGEHSIDLNASAAYSDSWYDVPLLELVGTPVAVNPDVRLSLTARARGWTRQDW